MRIIIFLLLSSVSITSFAIPMSVLKQERANFLHVVAQTPQNNLSYIGNENIIVKKSYQNRLKREFLARYFSPWTGRDRVAPMDEIKYQEKRLVPVFSRDPGYAKDGQVNDRNILRKAGNNMDMESFPNHIEKAIAVKGSNVRIMPTKLIVNNLPRTEGLDEPTDELQVAYLSANKPVEILQQTRDKKWDLIITGSYYGWVPAAHIASINTKLQKVIEQSTFMVPEQNFVVKSKSHKIPLRVGVLYPAKHVFSKQPDIYYVTANAKNQAVLQHLKLSDKPITAFPMRITSRNIATVANSFIGDPYSWGSVNGGHDCSSLLMAIYANFGIWLPRHSTEQAETGEQINFSKQTVHTKREMIANNGVPFLTVLYKDGHILMYIGRRDGVNYAYNTLGATVDKTLIMPVNPFLLARLKSMTYLVPPSEVQVQRA